MNRNPGSTIVISDDIRAAIARELVEEHGAFAFDQAWGIADAMRVAGSAAGYRTWCSIAGKVVALHILSNN